MKGICIHIYTNLSTKHKKLLVYEWLLQWAKKNQVKNITVFKSIAGILDHKIEEQHFVEMGSHIPVLISIILEDEKPLFSALKEEGISLFYTKSLLEFENI